MATTNTKIDIAAALAKSGAKFRKEILQMPIVALEKTLQYMTLRYGVCGEETVGDLKSGAQLRPYRTAKDETNTASMGARTLKTYLGDVVEEFDPSNLYETIFGDQLSKDITELDIVKKLALLMSASSTNKLGINMFNAVRNASGSTTADLFDGFDTICAAEVTAGNIDASKGNLFDCGAISEANAGERLSDLLAAASDELQDTDNVLLFVPRKIQRMYHKWYLANVGPVVYNKNYENDLLIDSNDQVRLVSPIGMKASTHLFLTTKSNMLVGVDQLSDAEKVSVRIPDNPKVVQFFLKMYWGVNFESIDAKRFCAATFTV